MKTPFLTVGFAAIVAGMPCCPSVCAQDAAPPAEAAAKPAFLADKAGLAKAQEDLLNLPALKGKAVKVFQNIHFYADGRVMLTLQDPDKPENIDQYQYANGQWGTPKPVQLMGDGKISSNVFPLKDIKFEAVAVIQAQLEEKAKAIEGGKPDGHIYLVLLVHNGTKKWYTNINGTRERWSGYFKPDGTLIEFKKI